MRTHGTCFNFVKTLKTGALSCSGKVNEKIQHKDFCTKFHTQVDPDGTVCRHHVTLDDIAGEMEDE